MYFKWFQINKSFGKSIKITDKPISVKIIISFPWLKLSDELIFKIKNFPANVNELILQIFQKIQKKLIKTKNIFKKRIKRIYKKSPVQIKLNLEFSGAKESKYKGYLIIILGFILILFPYIFKTVIDKNTYSYYPTSPPSFTQIASSSASLGINGENVKINTQINLVNSLPQPEKIIIPNIGINLKIDKAKIINGYWETSEINASHGEGSANPGEKGNIVIFAHAREGLFLPLKEIKEKDTIYVLTNEKWFEYEVKEIKTVSPDQIEYIAPTKDETLTLYTCTGFLDSKRLLIISKLKSS